MKSEPVSVNLLRSPGIDSQPGGPVRQHFLTYRPARLHRLAKSIPLNRYLGSWYVYKIGLCMTIVELLALIWFGSVSSRISTDLSRPGIPSAPSKSLSKIWNKRPKSYYRSLLICFWCTCKMTDSLSFSDSNAHIHLLASLLHKAHCWTVFSQ